MHLGQFEGITKTSSCLQSIATTANIQEPTSKMNESKVIAIIYKLE